MNPVILFDNLLSDTASVALAADRTVETGYAALNILDMRTYTRWKDDAVGTTYLTVEFSGNKVADAWAIAGHNFHLVTSLTISLEYWNGAAWVAVSSKNSFTAKAFMLTFTQVSGTKWRIKLVSSGSTTPEFGVAFVGVRITFEFPPDAGFVPLSKGVMGESEDSKAANFLGSVVRGKPGSIRPSFTNFTRTWVETYFEPFWDVYASELKPFFWAWDLETYPNEVYYCKINPDSLYEAPVSVLGLIDKISLDLKTEGL